MYTYPVEDTWFKATTKVDVGLGVGNLYFPDQPMTAIGCKEEFQFCNGEDRCSPMASSNAFWTGVPNVGYNKLQIATWELVKSSLSFMRLTLILQFLKNELLLANQLTYGGLSLSSGLQPDHWRNEMANIYNVSLAGMQAHLVLHAAPGNSEIKPGVKLHDFIIPETSPEHLKLCENQKFRSAEYSSISLLGLLIVILSCFTIIGLNIIVPHVVKFLQGVWHEKGAASKRAWIEDDVLQLQRIALEARGLGPWKGKIQAVPVLDSYGTEFQRVNFEGGYAEQVPLNDTHAPLYWDGKGQPEYQQRAI